MINAKEARGLSNNIDLTTRELLNEIEEKIKLFSKQGYYSFSFIKNTDYLAWKKEKIIDEILNVLKILGYHAKDLNSYNREDNYIKIEITW